MSDRETNRQIWGRLLPPGWTAERDDVQRNLWTLRGPTGWVSHHQVDRDIGIRSHLRYIWWRHCFPGEQDYIGRLADPDWLPEELRDSGG